MIVEIDPEHPQDWLLARAVDALRAGGVVVMPTDTVYGLTCSINRHDAINRIYRLKDMDPKKPLSILVGDMSAVGKYAKGVSTPAFRILKRVLPGPYTFILRGSNQLPKDFKKKKTVGIRVPDNAIAQALVLKPRILLLDEPFGALDPGIRGDMHRLLLDLWERHRLTVFMVTHDLKEAIRMGDVFGWMREGNLKTYPKLTGFLNDSETGIQDEIAFWASLQDDHEKGL